MGKKPGGGGFRYTAREVEKKGRRTSSIMISTHRLQKQVQRAIEVVIQEEGRGTARRDAAAFLPMVRPSARRVVQALVELKIIKISG